MLSHIIRVIKHSSIQNMEVMQEVNNEVYMIDFLLAFFVLFSNNANSTENRMFSLQENLAFESQSWYCHLQWCRVTDDRTYLYGSYLPTYILVLAQCYNSLANSMHHTIDFLQLCSILSQQLIIYDSNITIIRVEFMLILQ